MADAKASAPATGELEPIGGTPANNILVRPLNSIPSVPAGGYIGTMGKSALAGELRKALSSKLDVPYDVLSLAYAGQDLDDSLTLRDNGIVEPGAAARRSGARIELIFTLLANTIPGEARRQKEVAHREKAERDERQRLEREALQARAREEAAAHEAEQSRRHRVGAVEARLAANAPPVPPPNAAAPPEAAFQHARPPPVPAQAPVEPRPGAAAGMAAAAAAAGAAPGMQAAAQPPAAAAPPVRDNCVLRCLPIGVTWEGAEGGAGDPALALETRLSARVADVARQLQQALGARGAETLLLVHQGHVVQGNTTVGAAGIEDGGEVHYYFAVPGDVPPAAAEAEVEDQAAIAEAAAAEERAMAAAREREARQQVERLAAQEAQWQAREAAARAAAEAAAEPAAPAASAAPAVDDNDEDLYGEAEPSQGSDPRRQMLLDCSEVAPLFEGLAAVLTRKWSASSTALNPSRSTERLMESEIVSLLRRFVPDVTEHSYEDTPVTKLIVAAYRHGPAGVADAACKERLAGSLRAVLASVREGSLPDGHSRAVCRRLVEAFSAGPAAQVRIVEVLAEGLAAGQGAALRCSLPLALLARERALDRAAAALHPEAALAPPQLQQLACLYRQRLGLSELPSPPEEATPATDSARAVRPRLETPAPCSSEEAMAALAKHLDLATLALEFAADINLPPARAEERQVDLEALSQWAEASGRAAELQYDADKADLYEGPPASAEAPCLHPLAALKVLHGLIV